jgi:hypothetical protein
LLIKNNADLWKFAESIQDNLDKLNALVDAMAGEDFSRYERIVWRVICAFSWIIYRYWKMTLAGSENT